jgi:2'-5' RNA ligase
MRTFITLEFGPEVKEKIAKVQKTIRENSQSGRFKYIDNFHLTLKFLGEADSNKIELLYDGLEKRLQGVKRFSVNLEGIGAFGLRETIRTIYIGISGDTDTLKRAAEAAEEAACSAGYKRENSYSPHITIAQDVKLRVPFEKLKEKLSGKFISNINFDRVIIMKSEQIGNRRVYTPVKTIQLQ